MCSEASGWILYINLLYGMCLEKSRQSKLVIVFCAYYEPLNCLYYLATSDVFWTFFQWVNAFHIYDVFFLSFLINSCAPRVKMSIFFFIKIQNLTTYSSQHQHSIYKCFNTKKIGKKEMIIVSSLVAWTCVELHPEEQPSFVQPPKMLTTHQSHKTTSVILKKKKGKILN